jgi:hypothetical protein
MLICANGLSPCKGNWVLLSLSHGSRAILTQYTTIVARLGQINSKRVLNPTNVIVLFGL